MREEFEAWCVNEVELPEGYELNWNNDSVRLMYRGWVASRESLVVELPEYRMTYHATEATSDQDYYLDSEHDHAVDECRKAIHAAGVRTK